MIHIVDKISSTNDWLSKYNSQLHDTIISIEQTHGKGRRGNTWESAKGGFYVSVVSLNHKLLPLIVGISVLNALGHKCEGLNLKWPNDIFLKGKKLGGILCENFENYSIIGIGLNFRNKLRVSNSVNLKSHNIKIDSSVFFGLYLYYFDNFFSSTTADIIDEFTTHDLLLGNQIFWENKSGIAESIDSDGSLIVNLGSKKVNLYSEEVHLERC